MRNLKSESTTAKIPDAIRFRPLLLLDFDTREAYREFPMRARFLARWLDMPLTTFRVRRRRTARGWHVIIYSNHPRWAEYEPLAIVAAQALLGSDWKREGFNFVRALHLNDAPEAWQKLGRWNTLYIRKMGAFDLGIRESAPPASTLPEDHRPMNEG